MTGDNLYVELVEHDDATNVIVATADGGAVTAHTFVDMSPDDLAALMRDMTGALTRHGSVEDTLAAWALMMEA
jgi:hypothetical protein